MMDVHQQALWERLQQFKFDDGNPQLSFVGRLARENGWSTVHAGRVVEEYKRFLFLAMAGGHMVTPSEAVDRAWHLHLTYTRNYWERLCGEVLEHPLHHEPTRGGAEESAKFKDLYTKTLASYRRLFGEEPPADIWPDPGRLAGPAKRRAAADQGRNPQHPLARAGQAALLATGLVTLAGCSAAPVSDLVLAGVMILIVMVAVYSANRPQPRRRDGSGCSGGGCGGGSCSGGTHHGCGGGDSGGGDGGGCGGGCGGGGD
ncbi:MAG TPA: hypothetical protein VEI97_06395 [bacterium]|nr:hypothetical protein [bacterium]